MLIDGGDEVSAGCGMGLDFGSIGSDSDVVIASVGMVGLVTTTFCS